MKKQRPNDGASSNKDEGKTFKVGAMRGRMFVGSVERGCRTLAVGAMELPWVLIGGRPPIAPTGLLPSAPQKGVVHCVYSNGRGGLAIASLQASLGGEMVLGEERG